MKLVLVGKCLKVEVLINAKRERKEKKKAEILN
jgi:hypothetical protein